MFSAQQQPSADTKLQLTAARYCRQGLCQCGCDLYVVLQMGKVHFGVLLGWSVVQSIVLWFMVNQIASNEAAEHRALDLYSCCCIVGYGMVPLLVLSVAVLFTPR